MALTLLYYKSLQNYYITDIKMSSHPREGVMGIFHMCVTASKNQTEPEENSGQKLLDVKEDSRNTLKEMLWPPTDYVALIGQ